MSSVIIVPKEIARRADSLINSGVSASVVKGVELLLQENLFIDGGSGLPAINQLDCSALLKKGSTALQSVPFDLLGVDVNCHTVDVRKAYKKLALKYHPDKNPKTTPLFQLIQAASTKLTDSEQRAKEAIVAAQKRGAAGMRQEHRSSAASFHNAFQKNQQANPTSFPSAAGAKPAAANPSYGYQAQPQGNRAQPAAAQQQQQQYQYQQYQFKQQQPAQPQAGPSQATQSSKAQATPNVYGQPQASHNAQYQQYMSQQQQSQQQRPQQPQAAPQNVPQSSKSNESKGRNYYEELLKDQYRKAAAAEERAREYANRRFTEQQQKFGAGAANNPFEGQQQQQYQQAQPNLNPFRQQAAANPSAVPTAANPAGVPAAYDWRNVYQASINPKPTADASSKPQQAAPAAASNVPNVSSNPSGGGVAGTARTYRTGADGKVYVQQSFPTAPAATAESTKQTTEGVTSQQQRKVTVPKPSDFKFTSVTSTIIELEWKTSQMHHCNLAVEFSWKEKFPSFTPWETAEKLIRAGCCRKKNLKPKACYEFRIRSVEELAGGQLGNRSDWTEVLSIVMPTADQTNNHNNPPAQSAAATVNASNPFPKVRPTAAEVEPTPTPDMTDNYAKKSKGTNASAQNSAPAAANSAQQPPASTSNSGKPPIATKDTNSNNSNQSSIPNLAKKEQTGVKSAVDNSKNEKKVLPGARPRTPTQEKPSDEKVFKRFQSKSNLSKDDSGIFSPAQFQVDESNLKPRSLDDSGPLQRKHTMSQQKTDRADPSPVEKTLNKYFNSKDKNMSSSQREAWGKEQQKQQEQQQQEPVKGKKKRDSFESREKVDSARGNSVDDYSDRYSNDEFDEVSDEEEDVVRINLDRPRGVASVSSFDDELLGSQIQKNTKPAVAAKSNGGGGGAKMMGGGNRDEEDEILEESDDYSDSDHSSVISHQTGQRKLRPRRNNNRGSASRASISSTNNKKFDAHGNPFDFFELDASYDNLDSDEIQYYQLQPPSIGNGMSNNALNNRKSLSPVGKEGQYQVNYRHPVHAEPFPKSSVKGYVKGDRAIIGCAVCGDWVRVKIQIPVYDSSRRDSGGSEQGNNEPTSARKKQGSSSSSSAAQQKAVWGWCLRSDANHEFLRPIQGTRSSLGGGSSVGSSSVAGLATPLPAAKHGGSSAAVMTPLSHRSTAAGVSTPATNSAGKKIMSPPKESLQRGMTKANLGASAILNQSFFNLPKQTPTKEKMKKKQSTASVHSMASKGAHYPSIDESEEMNDSSSMKSARKSSGNGNNANNNNNGRKPPSSVEKAKNTENEEDSVEVWMECFDHNGHVYYYHEKSMVSKWELPEWVEEEDPSSGVKYYVHAVGYGDNITMTSTWTKPKHFARLIRSQQY